MAVPAAIRCGRRAAGGQGQFGHRVRRLVLGEAAGERGRVRVTDVVEGDDLDQLGAAGVRSRLDERRIGAGSPPDGLRRVVDQDVERTLLGHGVRERDDLGGVAQVDAHDAQPVQPVGAVGHRGETAHGVVREAGGDRRVGAVAQQSQRDVHADLGAAAGEQGAPAVRSVRASRLARLSAAQSGQSWW